MVPLPTLEMDEVRVPYALRHVPRAAFASLLPLGGVPAVGDVVLAAVEEIGRNTALELSDGRRCTLHEGDRLAVVFGNRYATAQFEGYARAQGDRCDLLSMGGLCGLVKSKHDGVAGPTRLRLLGRVADREGRPVCAADFRLRPAATEGRIRVITVCGTSMDAGKTYTAQCTIQWLRDQGHRVAAIKLTGSAAGRDTWNMRDAGACVALDFTDGGMPSTYLCTLEQLLDLYDLLIGHAKAHRAQWAVVEIADGLLQRETAALLQSSRFTSKVDAFLFAAGEPLAAAGGVALLHGWGIEPIAVSGLVSMSALGVREVESATGLRCLTASELQQEGLRPLLDARSERGAAPMELRAAGRRG
jgi:hypothetical protein